MGLIHLCGLEPAEGDYINMTAISLEQEDETREELNKEEDAMVSGDFRFLAWSYILISSVWSWAGLLALCHWEESQVPLCFPRQHALLILSGISPELVLQGRDP